MKLTSLKSFRAGVAAVALIVAGASAQAQFSGVKSLEITELSFFDGGISFAEVMAFSSLNGTGTNFALDTNQGSSTSPAGFGSVSGDAIDGNTNGDFFANSGDGTGSVWHDPDANSAILDTYTVVFDAAQTVGSVNIFGRTDCCQQRDGNSTVSNLQLTLRDAGGGVLFQQAFGIPDANQQILIPVPEPSAFALSGLAAAGLAMIRRRRR